MLEIKISPFTYLGNEVPLGGKFDAIVIPALFCNNSGLQKSTT